MLDEKLQSGVIVQSEHHRVKYRETEHGKPAVAFQLLDVFHRTHLRIDLRLEKQTEDLAINAEWYSTAQPAPTA